MDRLLRPKHASRTRLIMAGAVLGAVIALTISVTLASSGPSDSGSAGFDGGPEGGGLPDSRSEQDIKYSYAAPVGTCLNWNTEQGTDMHQVACAEPHVFEVTEVIDVSEDFPPGARQPDKERWRAIAEKRCVQGVEAYLGKPLDPDGKLQVSALRPNKADWDRGLRALRCGVWRTGPGGSLQATKGSALEQNQSNVWAQGTCLALAGKSVGDPIDCSQRHSYEMIALVDLSDEFGKSYPSRSKQDAWLDKKCSSAADKYTGGADLEKMKLIVSWDTRTKASWRAGSYLVNCKVAALLDDKSGLAPVTGSVAKGARDEEKPSVSDKPKPKTSGTSKPGR